MFQKLFFQLKKNILYNYIYKKYYIKYSTIAFARYESLSKSQFNYNAMIFKSTENNTKMNTNFSQVQYLTCCICTTVL